MQFAVQAQCIDDEVCQCSFFLAADRNQVVDGNVQMANQDAEIRQLPVDHQQVFGGLRRQWFLFHIISEASKRHIDSSQLPGERWIEVC